MKILYETVVTDKFIENKDFICLDLIDVCDLDKSQTYICFVSHQTRKKLEKENINIYLNDHPDQFTTKFLISHFNEFTLTQDMVLVPFGAILNGVQAETIFIRPNTGFKLFPGQSLNINDIETFSNTYKISNDVLCARSSTVNIVSEKRTFINCINKHKITESLYAHDRKPVGKDFDVTDILEKIFSKDEIDLLPDRVVADFALLDNGEIRLIEFNSIITSGHYNCNMYDIISDIKN